MKSGSKKFRVEFGSRLSSIRVEFRLSLGWVRVEYGSGTGRGLDQVHKYPTTSLFLRLNTARSFVRSLQTSSNPISTGNGDESESIKLSAQVLGLGPVFKLVIGLCNTSTSTPSRYLLITFYCDDKMYRYEIYRLHQKNLQSSGIISYVF